MAPGLALINSFRYLAGRHEHIICADNLDHIGGFAVHRQLARPGQGGSPAFAWLTEGPTVDRHFIFAELAQDRAR